MFSLPPSQKTTVEHYFRIKFGSYSLPCPYYMNKRGRKFLSPVLAGKGTPDEIEQELSQYYEMKGHSLKDEIDALNVMKLLEIGIDCSGFVVNVLKIRPRDVNYRNLISRLKAWIRPRTGMSADLLTGPLNSFTVSISEVKPGDLIRRGKSHVMLVEWVDGNRFGYVSSSTRPQWGVQRGEIEIIEGSLPLENQKWSVEDDLGMYKKAGEDKGLRRLKIRL